MRKAVVLAAALMTLFSIRLAGAQCCDTSTEEGDNLGKRCMTPEEAVVAGKPGGCYDDKAGNCFGSSLAVGNLPQLDPSRGTVPVSPPKGCACIGGKCKADTSWHPPVGTVPNPIDNGYDDGSNCTNAAVDACCAGEACL